MEGREILRAHFMYYFDEYKKLKAELDRQIEDGSIKGERLQQALKEMDAVQELIREILKELKKGENEHINFVLCNKHPDSWNCKRCIACYGQQHF